MDLRVRKYLDGGCRIVAVTEVVAVPPIRVIIVCMTCMNIKTSDNFDAVSLELQEIQDQFSTSHAIILLGDLHSSLLSRVNNDKDK